MKRLLFSVLFSTLVLAQVLSMGEVERDRYFEPFDRLAVHTSGVMTVSAGNDYRLEISGQDKYIARIVTEVRNKTLIIEEEGWLSGVRGLSYHLTVPNLNSVKTTSSCDIELGAMRGNEVEIIITSSGDISAEQLAADNIILKSSSSGDIFISDLAAATLDITLSSSGSCEIYGGSVSRQKIHLTSSGSVIAEELASVEADVVLSSSGDAFIYVSDFVEAVLSSSGDLYVSGNPATEKIRTTSSGDYLSR